MSSSSFPDPQLEGVLQRSLEVRLKKHVCLSGVTAKVSVNGHSAVELDGDLRRFYEKQLAYRAARDVLGEAVEIEDRTRVVEQDAR